MSPILQSEQSIVAGTTPFTNLGILPSLYNLDMVL